MKISHIFTNNFKPGKLFQIPDQPLNIMLDITNTCNNKCLYCYNPNDQSYQDAPPHSDVLKEVVSTIGKTGTREILYLGGEPFASPVIKELLEIGQEQKIFQRAISNGSFFKNLKICNEFKEKGLDEVGISFHSANENIHDKISGRKGSYRDALLGVENCIRAKINVFLQYSPNNYNSDDDILILAQIFKKRFKDKIKFIDINRLLPIGQGEKVKHLFLEDDEWFYFLKTATILNEYGFDVHTELTPFCWIKNKAKKNNTPDDTVKNIFNMNRGCFMWIAQLALNYEGKIKFCPAGTAVGPCILKVKWPNFWKNWGNFQKYRNFFWNKTCVNFNNNTACKYFYRCLGGCKYSRGIHYIIDKLSCGPCR